jgi:hypothetical protein
VSTDDLSDANEALSLGVDVLEDMKSVKGAVTTTFVLMSLVLIAPFLPMLVRCFFPSSSPLVRAQFGFFVTGIVMLVAVIPLFSALGKWSDVHSVLEDAGSSWEFVISVLVGPGFKACQGLSAGAFIMGALNVAGDGLSLLASRRFAEADAVKAQAPGSSVPAFTTIVITSPISIASAMQVPTPTDRT